MRETLPFIEDAGGLRAVVCLYDIDGTVNDQGPEAQRLASTAPGKEALSRLHAIGIPTGPITSRSTGEALHYAEHLDSSGIAVTEDGGVIALTTARQQALFHARMRTCIDTRTQRPLLLMSETKLEDFDAMFARVRRAFPDLALVSTRTSPPEHLQAAAGHESTEMAARSAERFASAYAIAATAAQREAMLLESAAASIRAFGDPVNLIGMDVNKGKALRFLHEHAAEIFGHPGITGIFPIVFGNDVNDVPGFAFTREIGGIAVMVAKTDGEFRVPESDLPEGTLLQREPYGFGMLAAVETIQKQLATRYALRTLGLS